MTTSSSIQKITDFQTVIAKSLGQWRWSAVFYGVTLMVALSGCPTMADYGAVTSGDGRDFVAPHEQFQVDPMDYPIFAIKKDREAPRAVVNFPRNDGVEMPPLKQSYRWQVTHKVYGEYLFGSEKFDQAWCRQTRDGRDHPEHCESGGIGAEYLERIYVHPDGSAYAYGYLKNTPRWPHWFGKDETWFRHDDTGDWSGQPWFECVARCDKLKNMSNESE